ncbi:imidazole glycerol phosphate synthase subunit HisH [Marivirga arenosa]|uniref:Imidazole glycerol phosphate synthase subunit HisH n=1 Tax=Marivirga arenosa TaxID=3059076 RepID=A0AA49GFY2_9BACT|nr:MULTISPECIES: imidazole glycerol phosphate synthase subunit HisH [unclassified Marivirga]WKK79454.1 imidazole glycerol phosphate synthase subunit HisH [Marivirga sp. BKB1-2]WMN06177.1 imidazole glycerol phosphate synthase subunit HisH [Marivirga sp. ABR2-2]
MKVAVIKYNAGNIKSVMLALKRMGLEGHLTDNPEEILSADRVIFPGQGEASSAMKYLKERELDQVIKSIKNPFLGICLGLQLLCSHTEEGDTACLNIFDAKVKKFPMDLKVPHMGWNTASISDDPIFKGIASPAYFYFVHSYYAEVCDQTISETNYMVPFSNALKKDNYYAIQPHPEKSAEAGDQFLRNFLFEI